MEHSPVESKPTPLAVAHEVLAVMRTDDMQRYASISDPDSRLNQLIGSDDKADPTYDVSLHAAQAALSLYQAYPNQEKWNALSNKRTLVARNTGLYAVVGGLIEPSDFSEVFDDVLHTARFIGYTRNDTKNMTDLLQSGLFGEIVTTERTTEELELLLQGYKLVATPRRYDRVYRMALGPFAYRQMKRNA